MAFTEREKARIVAKYIRTGSATTTQRLVSTRMQKTPPSRNTIIHWHNLFMGNGNMGYRRGKERPRTSEITVKQVRLIFENNLA